MHPDTPMKLKNTLLNLTALLLTASTALLHGAGYEWSNFAGLPGGEGNVDGTGSAARFDSPYGLAVDSAGTVYVADSGNNVIRKITKTGVVTTLAGQAGIQGHADGTGAAARFSSPKGIILGSGGVLYVTDSSNGVIRKVTSAGVVTTLAGKAGQFGASDGTGEAARFYLPNGLTLAADGSLLVCDTYNHTVRKVTTAGVVTTLAGQAGVSGAADGTLTAARFKRPECITRASDGTLYIADNGNATIRKITPAGMVSTLAGKVGTEGSADGIGTAAEFDYPMGLLVRPNGMLWVADSNNGTIRQITQAGEVTTIMGAAGQWFSLDGTGTAARFAGPYAITTDTAGTVYIADAWAQTIRKANAALQVTTFAGSAENRGSVDGTGTAARFNVPQGLSVTSGGEVFIADGNNYKIRKAMPDGTVSTYAGNGTRSSADGPLANATLDYVTDTGFDAAGNMYVAEASGAIRLIDTAGMVSTFAGTAGSYGTADGKGPAARFSSTLGIDVAADGTIYVADYWSHTIRKVSPTGEVTTLAGKPNVGGYVDGTGADARFGRPTDVAVDADGYVYVADSSNNCIRKISLLGEVTTLAGKSGSQGSADGAGQAARFREPTGVALDPYGNIIVCDSMNHTLRRVSQTGVVTTIGGSPLLADGQDGADTAARFSRPHRLTVTSTGLIYVTDFNNNRIVKGVPHPEIAIEASVGGDLKDGAAIDYGAVSIHEDVVRTFTLTNRGGLPLTGVAVNLSGTHAADFVTDGVKPILNPGETAIFTVTYQGNSTGLRTAALEITSNDADEATFDIGLKVTSQDMPFVTTAPSSQVAREGDAVTFTAQGTHPTAAVTYQWLKNGSKITGATSSTYQKNGLKLADGGTYTVEMKSNGFTVRRSATLVVAKYVEQIHIVKVGSTLKLSAITNGPATYAWSKDNGITLHTSQTFNVALPNIGLSGIYRCYVSGPGGGSVLAAVFDVRVLSSKPSVAQYQYMPDGAVGRPYSHQIALASSATFLAPASYSASGLPPGVTLNTKTGLISGTPTVAKTYEIIVTAKNLQGSHSSLKDIITITPLSTKLIGTYTGIVSRNDSLSSLGGRVDLTITSTAAMSGSVVVGTKTHAFKGQLVMGGANPTATITVPRAGLSSLILTLVMDLGTQTFITGSKLSLGAADAAVSGWRLKWKATGTPATTTPKLFTFGLRPPTGVKGIPAGDGFGSFTLPASGMVNITGKTPDGTSFTHATFVGGQGQIGIFKTLHTPVGSLLGTLDMDSVNNGNLEDVLGGSVSWSRPANDKSRYSPKGFGPITLTAFGGLHRLPDFAPHHVLNMLLDDKAMLTFAEGGLSTASINPDVPAFDILLGNKPSLPAPLSSGNPGSVKITSLNAKAGTFTGTFTLEDTELRTGPAFAGKKLKRTAEFSGVFTQDSMGSVGVGHFLLPEMPVDAMAPLPATTPTTTEILSGNLIMEKKM